ncbi:DUF151 domain-containing [Micractinium conductrix]|uniref:DUF151 domain-containing n=1 Tax=Micractinium conductrix TaxID=554055 RepID=A0A2P6VLH3_9CHLO|nr:DUF151 domain-containing [Micractinium conductrix]|eukprot:PSC74915.1 DUF151 domain-containing [Micractinium conductrix]
MPLAAALLGRHAGLAGAPRPACSSRSRPARRGLAPRASGSDDWLSSYDEAHIVEVRATDKHGHVVLLKLKESAVLLPVYIGEFECTSLVKEINKKPTPRPLTHDLMKTMLETLGFRVTMVRITALVGNTYHARVHLARGRRQRLGEAAEASMPAEVDIDARPSDAVNLAVRFGATIYVNREVGAKMGHPVHAFVESGSAGGGSNGSGAGEQHAEVVRSCREEIMAYSDPTIMHKLQLQLAIAEERFEDATALRDAIDKILASDRALSLVVAMETAIEDGRFEEASRLRDEFKALRKAQQLSSSEISDLS